LAVDFEGTKTVTVSREFAFQKPKFDTRVDEEIETKGAKVRLLPPCLLPP
jgi:hypothetical protein